ncbi:MAG TPA: carcinine hydrolase/isopenicillin-N N-acyltransferase family protein [Kofleriaceae bacterium]|nr:carcinine hydrolase/isopenicillin-N N-acyltransferase family protein [Kofleriaceae bacterium]
MPDLVIGGRRASVVRPWRAGVIAIAMLGVVVVVAWFIYRRSVAYDMPAGEVQGELSWVQPAPGAPPALAYGNASLTWVGGLAVLRVTGDAHAIGAAHGRLLAPWLSPTIAAVAPSIAGTISDDGLLGELTHGIRLAWRWRFIDDGLIEQDRRMVAGMTRGAAASGVELRYDELLRDQAVLDVGAPSLRSDAVEQHVIAHSLTLIGSQAQVPARVWIGRTLALPGLDDGGDAEIPVVTIAKPEGRIAWAGVGWPGQLGTVTGINAEGIVVTVDPVRTIDVRVTRTARPIALLARTVLEQARTLDDAIKLIESSATLGSAVIAVIDGTSSRWVQIERTPSKAIVERSPKLPVLGDVLTTNALASDPENDRTRRMLPTQSRIERATKLLRGPLGEVGAMAAILRDQRAGDESPRPLGHRGVIDDGRAVQVVIIDPASLSLWVADPRAAGRMRAFDLRHELRNEGDRAAPAADIPAEPGVELDRAEGLAAARADLRIARAALRAGDRGRAAEACARARARAPALPEAIELDAIIAHARGDLAHARAAFQAWLDGGPDDPHGEERARAALAR